MRLNVPSSSRGPQEPLQVSVDFDVSASPINLSKSANRSHLGAVDLNSSHRTTSFLRSPKRAGKSGVVAGNGSPFLKTMTENKDTQNYIARLEDGKQCCVAYC